jgi:hypothetical protein
MALTGLVSLVDRVLNQTAGQAQSASARCAATVAGTAGVQGQLQTLNKALEALGLSDQIASLTNDFNPTAFTSLVYQLEAQGRITASPAAAAPANPAEAAVNSGTTNATNRR